MKKRIFALIVLAVIAGLAFAGADLMRSYRGYTGRVIVEIPPGMRAPQVADLLKSRGVLEHRLPFLLLYAAGRWRHRSIEAGSYLFDRPLRPLDVYRKLVRGEVYFFTVVIPEGSNRFDIARILNEKLSIAPEEFLRLTRDTSAIRDLDPQAPTLEGYLFPDTYRFEYHTSAAGVVTAMVTQFRRVLHHDFGEDFNGADSSLHKVLTLASLVEKETPDSGERSIVSQVFELRLQKRMLLQCDPTVLYAAELDRRSIATITADDLNFQSSYNTYLYAGLPPGPICNPGKASIRAALHPASTRYLYFVSNNHGGHTFATTLAEHQRNVARYRKQVAAHQQAASSVAGRR